MSDSPLNSPATVRPLGFGIVGLGMIADFHARAIAQTTGGRVLGVASRNLENAAVFAQKHGVPFVTASVDELVRRPEIDVICITTPSGAHREPALAAIQARKHIVIEKPIEITTERADEILDAADRAGVLIAPIFQARFGEGARAVKAAVDAGRFGRLVLASVYVKWHRSAEYYRGWKGTLKLDGGGALINQSIHGVDLLQWFVGLPQQVFAWKTRRVHTGIEAEDTLAGSLRFPDGALGGVEVSTALFPGWRRRIELCGETGSVVLEDDTITHWEFRTPRPEDAAITSGTAAAALGSGASAPNAISIEGHRRQLQNLIDAVQRGVPLAIGGREARKAVALVRALYTSAERGMPVDL